MKFTVIALLAACLQVSAIGNAQKITLRETNAPIVRLFTAIEKQSGYQFWYDREVLSKTKRVTIDVSDVSLEQALQLCFKDQPVVFTIVKKTIVVKERKKDTNGQPAAFVLPPVDVKGILINENKEPLEGVTVIVKGSGKGTSTNGKGEFELKNIPDDAVLVFSGTLIETFETPLKGRLFLSLTATTKISNMQDVAIVSTGYQKTEKRRLIGAVEVVSGEELKDAPTTGSFEKSLAGRVAGVYIRSNAGRPGESGTVQIRGVNTLTGNREPLWVLDGMPLPTGEVSSSVNELITRGLGNIPPEDIESITILKDATASAIYGARAANGVIVVTTKQGKAGKNYLSYSGRYGISEKPRNKFSFMNTDEKIAFERSLFDDFKDSYGGRVVQLLNAVEKGSLTQPEGEAQIAALATTNTDWMDVIMQNAASQSHVLSLSGGNDKTQYYSSLNYTKSSGVLRTNRYENAGLNIKLSNYVRPNLLVRFNLYGTVKKSREGQSVVDPFTYATFANPYEKPYNPDGSYADDKTYVLTSSDVADPYSGYDHFNILNELSNNTKTDNYGNVRAQLGAEYNFLNHFRLTATGTFNYISVQSMDESAPGTYRSKVNNWMKFVFPDIYTSGIPDSYNNGFLRESSARATDYALRTTLEYNRNFKKHFLLAMVAGELGGNKNSQFYNLNPVYYPEARVAGYPDMYSYFPSTRLNLKALGGTGFTEEKSASFITSLNYSYDNRFVVNGSFRSDGISILGNDNQFTPLWSAGIQWNLHNEDFVKQFGIIDRLVVRLGYGYRGSINQNGVYPFSYYSINTSGSTYGGILYGNSITYGNPVLKWEKKQNKDAGLEISLFKGRLNAEISYFNERTTDLLDQVQVAASSGRTTTRENASSVGNKGFEWALRGELIKTPTFLWELGANLANIKNEVLSTYYSEAPSQEVTDLNFDTRFVKGYPVDGWFGLKFTGVDPSTGHLMTMARKQSRNEKDGKVTFSYTDEEIDVTAISFNDIITQYRPYYLGSKQPDIYGGFQNRFVYKNWDLYAGFSFAAGNTILGFNERWATPDARSSDTKISRLNRLKENTNRWRSPGDITDIPLYYLNTNAFKSVFTDYDLESGSYLKCQSLALSYRLPQTILNRNNLSNAKIGVAITNLFTLSKYSGTDPETQTAFGYPNTRMYSLSLEIGL